jgi:hypothetical protein
MGEHAGSFVPPQPEALPAWQDNGDLGQRFKVVTHGLETQGDRFQLDYNDLASLANSIDTGLAARQGVDERNVQTVQSAINELRDSERPGDRPLSEAQAQLHLKAKGEKAWLAGVYERTGGADPEEAARQYGESWEGEAGLGRRERAQYKVYRDQRLLRQEWGVPQTADEVAEYLIHQANEHGFRSSEVSDALFEHGSKLSLKDYTSFIEAGRQDQGFGSSEDADNAHATIAATGKHAQGSGLAEESEPVERQDTEEPRGWFTPGPKIQSSPEDDLPVEPVPAVEQETVVPDEQTVAIVPRTSNASPITSLAGIHTSTPTTSVSISAGAATVTGRREQPVVTGRHRDRLRTWAAGQRDRRALRRERGTQERTPLDDILDGSEHTDTTAEQQEVYPGLQVEAGDTRIDYEDGRHAQDRIVRNTFANVYAAIDGSTGSKDGRRAAEVGASSFERSGVAISDQLHRQKANINDVLRAVRAATDNASLEVDRHVPEGYATFSGFVVVSREQLVDTSMLEADDIGVYVWAAVGDARIYGYDAKEGRVTQLNTDESHIEALMAAGHLERDKTIPPDLPNARVIHNQLGQGGRVDPNNLGYLAIKKGDGVFVCSDGVMSHKGEGISTDVLSGLFANNGDDAQVISDQAIQASRTRDDRSGVAVVF